MALPVVPSQGTGGQGVGWYLSQQPRGVEVLGEVRRPRLLTACNGNSVGFGVLFVCGFCYHALLIGAFENVALKKRNVLLKLNVPVGTWIVVHSFIYFMRTKRDVCVRAHYLTICTSKKWTYTHFKNNLTRRADTEILNRCIWCKKKGEHQKESDTVAIRKVSGRTLPMLINVKPIFIGHRLRHIFLCRTSSTHQTPRSANIAGITHIL